MPELDFETAVRDIRDSLNQGDYGRKGDFLRKVFVPDKWLTEHDVRLRPGETFFGKEVMEVQRDIARRGTEVILYD